MKKQDSNLMLREIAARIRDLREITGKSAEETAAAAEVSLEEYLLCEEGKRDIPFTFIHKCALFFGVELSDLLEGNSARLSSYNVTRKNQGQITAREDGIEISNLAPRFQNKLAEPFYVKYSYDPALQNKPIHTTTHAGQEFDIILSGSLKVRVGDNVEILEEGDSIFYNSSEPHGMIAVGGKDCTFCAIVMSGENEESDVFGQTITAVRQPAKQMVYSNFIDTVEDENGALLSVSFKNEDKFNFAFDIVDVLGTQQPDKLAMLHISRDKVERRFTFADIKRESARTANYFKSLGIKRGDRVMLVLRRNYQFWFAILALHKLGAIAIPATDQLLAHDFEYRFEAAGVNAIILSGDSGVYAEAEKAIEAVGGDMIKVITNTVREGWHYFDEEYKMYSSRYERTEDSACGDDPMAMFFTSGTTGYPKIAMHSHKYPLGHFITAKYWHCVETDGIHFTISDTGWGKSLWGKLYGQWICEAAVFVYDFERFDASDILPMFAKYGITTFCAPPTMYRFMIKEDLSGYDLSTIHHATTAGEALNPEVYYRFLEATGLSVMEGFGQTETTLAIGNFVGMTPKIGSMGVPSPMYRISLLDGDGNTVPTGETGEICIDVSGGDPCGLFLGYYNNEESTKNVYHDGWYHTGDTAWMDEDGYLWYVGRVDDVIKSSGYRIGPFEIESVIMELPYVLECGVSAAPDEIRGQVVKASIVLTKGTVGTDELKKEIQEYVKTHTAPYKYPRIVVFRDELPKTISGKIQRNKL